MPEPGQRTVRIELMDERLGELCELAEWRGLTPEALLAEIADEAIAFDHPLMLEAKGWQVADIMAAADHQDLLAPAADDATQGLLAEAEEHVG